jgi:hypothetical protein
MCALLRVLYYCLCFTTACGPAGHALPVDGGLTIQLQEDMAMGRGKFLQQRPDVLAKL